MRRTLVFGSLLFAVTFTQVAYGQQTGSGTQVNPFLDFLNTHVIGKTLVHTEKLPPRKMRVTETEVTYRNTYTNLVKGAETLAFDVLSVVIETTYPLDPDGIRLAQERSISRQISVARYTLQNDGSGTGLCVADTLEERIGTVTIIKMWFAGAALKLISTTLEWRVPSIRMQEFRVVDERLIGKSYAIRYGADSDTLALRPYADNGKTRLWREEEALPVEEAREKALEGTVAEREALLLQAFKKGGEATTFLVGREEGVYPCRIFGGIIESQPLQANVKIYHDAARFQTPFHELAHLEELPDYVTLEVFTESEWAKMHDWQWDGRSFIGKSDEKAAWKKYTLDQIRFTFDLDEDFLDALGW